MTHAQGILEQLRMAEQDDDLPEDIRDSCAERADELETELEDTDNGDN